MTDIDWGRVDKESEGGMTYPAGDYTVRINAWEYTVAKTGTDQIKWHGVIESCENENLINKPITEFTALTEKSFWRLGKLVKGCGINIKGLSKMKIKTPDFAKVMNLTRNRLTIWKLIVEPDKNNVDRNKVEDFIPVPDQDTIDAVEALQGEVPDFLKDS